MANVRPYDLPAAGSVGTTDAIIVDNDIVVSKCTPQQIVDAVRPVASQAEAEAGAENTKLMTPLRVQQNRAILETSLAAVTGAGLIGATGGITVQAALNGKMPTTGGTFNLSTSTLTGTLAQFNTACSDADFASLAGAETLTNKTFNLANNTLTGTTAQFNTALSDGDFATLAGTQTLTATRVNPRVSTTASSATPTPNADTDDQYQLTALAAAAAFAVPSGTPVNGQKMMIRIKDNGTARALTYNAIYRAIGVTLPTTTVINKTLYLGMVYNSADTKWDVVAVGQEA